MKQKTMFLLAVLFVGAVSALFAGVQFAFAGGQGSNKNETVSTDSEEECPNLGKPIPLKEAKLNIEHNDKDKDTGFQGFLDSEGWNEMIVTGPDGQVLEFEGNGKLEELGLTELFFETVEPANEDVPIEEVLETLPEGKYKFEGCAIEAGEIQGRTTGTALLTHDIPEGPEILSPEEEAEVPEDEDLLVDWEPVDKTINGDNVKIIAYQLIIEKDAEPDPHMIGTFGLSMYLSPDVTEMTIPEEFLEPETDYEWEVLAIEDSGNQSINSSSFSTGE
jgi:hypothetical protein